MELIEGDVMSKLNVSVEVKMLGGEVTVTEPLAKMKLNLEVSDVVDVHCEEVEELLPSREKKDLSLNP